MRVREIVRVVCERESVCRECRRERQTSCLSCIFMLAIVRVNTMYASERESESGV